MRRVLRDRVGAEAQREHVVEELVRPPSGFLKRFKGSHAVGEDKIKTLPTPPIEQGECEFGFDGVLQQMSVLSLRHLLMPRSLLPFGALENALRVLFQFPYFLINSSSRMFRHSSSVGGGASVLSSPTRSLSDLVVGSSEMGRASKDSRIRHARVIPCAGDQVLTRSRTSLIGSLSTTLMVQSPSAASKRAFSSMLTPPLAFTISLPKGSRTRRSLGWVVPHSKTT